jgi:hypothetical protein
VRYPETVVRLRAPMVENRYGAQVRDWSNAAELTVSGVQVQPSSSEEPSEVGRSSVVTHMRLLTPIGTDLDLVATDRIRWADVVWAVDGEVARHKRPSTGAVHHVEAMLTRVAG